MAWKQNVLSFSVDHSVAFLLTTDVSGDVWLLIIPRLLQQEVGSQILILLAGKVSLND